MRPRKNFCISAGIDAARRIEISKENQRTGQIIMLQNIDLTRTIDKASFKAQKTEADLKLGDLQRTAKSLEIPTIILFEGWSASGKGNAGS
jgi:polyphosphate kinase 2 (PPK2 family)